MLLSLLIGVIAGLRAMTALAAISWAARIGRLDLTSSGLAFLGYAYAPWIFTVFALAELVTDQLPTTPSRTLPVPFGTRLVSGALCGAAIGLPGRGMLLGGILGAVGAVIGTFGGRAARAWLAKTLGNDHPAAFIEDAVAIGGALVVVAMLP